MTTITDDFRVTVEPLSEHQLHAGVTDLPTWAVLRFDDQKSLEIQLYYNDCFEIGFSRELWRYGPGNPAGAVPPEGTGDIESRPSAGPHDSQFVFLTFKGRSGWYRMSFRLDELTAFLNRTLESVSWDQAAETYNVDAAIRQIFDWKDDPS